MFEIRSIDECFVLFTFVQLFLFSKYNKDNALSFHET